MNKAPLLLAAACCFALAAPVHADSDSAGAMPGMVKSKGKMGFHKGIDIEVFLDRLRSAQPPMMVAPAAEDEGGD